MILIEIEAKKKATRKVGTKAVAERRKVIMLGIMLRNWNKLRIIMTMNSITNEIVSTMEVRKSNMITTPYMLFLIQNIKIPRPKIAVLNTVIIAWINKIILTLIYILSDLIAILAAIAIII